MQSEINVTVRSSTPAKSKAQSSVFLPRHFVLQSNLGFSIKLADHLGMCFGVRDAIALAEKKSGDGNLTILGELVHNEAVRENLRQIGAQEGSLKHDQAATSEVLITAHGASDREKSRWLGLGHQVQDATCPLVRKAHTALATLVAKGSFPVVIGKVGHAEVEGLIGDFPNSEVVLSEEDIMNLAEKRHYGIVSQTTLPIDFVEGLVASFQKYHPDSEITFRDTVCQPTKNRQRALHQLAAQVDLVIVVGGENSNNSRQLAEKARELGCRAERISEASQINPDWLKEVDSAGITAGTSTLGSCVEKVVKALEQLGGRQEDA